jgi:hypothetical protein
MPISYGPWQAYPWKAELALQRERVTIHFAEMLQEDFTGSHNPLDMLERALVLAAFAMRRMFEKRLVTDKLAAVIADIRTFKSRGENFRQPYVGYGGGQAFRNYDLQDAGIQRLKLNDLANEIIHSSQLMVVENEPRIPTGLLVASDWNLKNRLLHLTIDEFMAVSEQLLDDTVRAASESWDWETGKVLAARE